MSTNIYILRLQGGRFYVGKTADTARRYQEHLEGKGAAWTKKYKPLALERVITNASPFDEDKYTKELMAKHGIDKVRGGAYVLEELEEFQEEALRREIWGAGDKCTLCGRAGHFVKDCYARTDVEGNEIIYESDSDCSSESSRRGSPQFYNPFYGLHTIQKGIETPMPFIHHECKRKEEEPRAAVKKVVAKVYEQPIPVVKKVIAKVCEQPIPVVKKVVANACYRCGRPGHYSPDCYARTHIQGYELD